MPTAEELFSTNSEDGTRHFRVSEDYRTVTVPSGEEILGVVGDKDVRRVWFDAPKFCDGLDMSDFDFGVAFEDASGELHRYTASDLRDNGDGTLTFSWVVGEDAFVEAGTVRFGVFAELTEGGEVVNDFNTTVAEGRVLEGLGE